MFFFFSLISVKLFSHDNILRIQTARCKSAPKNLRTIHNNTHGSHRLPAEAFESIFVKSQSTELTPSSLSDDKFYMTSYDRVRRNRRVREKTRVHDRNTCVKKKNRVYDEMNVKTKKKK